MTHETEGDRKALLAEARRVMRVLELGGNKPSSEAEAMLRLALSELERVERELEQRNEAVARITEDEQRLRRLDERSRGERDAARAEAEALRREKKRGDEMDVFNHGRFVEVTRDLAAAQAELERWRHGVPVEGDYVCPDSTALSAAQAREAKLREALEAVVELFEMDDESNTVGTDSWAALAKGRAALAEGGEG